MQVFMRQTSRSTSSSASSSVRELIAEGVVGEAEERLEGVLKGCRGVEDDGWVSSSAGVVGWLRCRLVGRDKRSSSSAFRLHDLGAIAVSFVGEVVVKVKVEVVVVRSEEWCS